MNLSRRPTPLSCPEWPLLCPWQLWQKQPFSKNLKNTTYTKLLKWIKLNTVFKNIATQWFWNWIYIVLTSIFQLFIIFAKNETGYIQRLNWNSKYWSFTQSVNIPLILYTVCAVLTDSIFSLFTSLKIKDFL